MSSAVGLYALGETNEASEQLEDFYLEHKMALSNTMFNQHPRQLYTWTSPDDRRWWVYDRILYKVKLGAGNQGINAENMEKWQHTDFNEDKTN